MFLLPFQQQSNQDTDERDFGQNCEQSGESTITSPNKNFTNSQIDFDEFRPIQVIDYKNKKQTPGAPFINATKFSNIVSANKLFVHKNEEVFPRKIIEYDHKTKTHQWNWFCPVIQIEYNHSKIGRSLHEHPPPKPVKPEPVLEQRITQERGKRDHLQMKHPKWPPNERQERILPVNQGERHHQSRFDNRPIPNDMQPYSRRNPQERNWPRNYREWNTQQDNHDYGYDR